MGRAVRRQSLRRRRCGAGQNVLGVNALRRPAEAAWAGAGVARRRGGVSRDLTPDGDKGLLARDGEGLVGLGNLGSSFWQ